MRETAYCKSTADRQPAIHVHLLSLPSSGGQPLVAQRSSVNMHTAVFYRKGWETTLLRAQEPACAAITGRCASAGPLRACVQAFLCSPPQLVAVHVEHSSCCGKGPAYAAAAI